VKNYRSLQSTEKFIGRIKLKDVKKNETKSNRGVIDIEKEVMIGNRHKTETARRK
jgi:hypothetical protein